MKDKECDTLKITLNKRAKKALDEMQPKRQAVIKAAIRNLPNGDVKSLVGLKPYKRLRVGSYRVVFKEQNGEIFITKIESRGDAYKGAI